MQSSADDDCEDTRDGHQSRTHGMGGMSRSSRSGSLAAVLSPGSAAVTSGAGAVRPAALEAGSDLAPTSGSVASYGFHVTSRPTPYQPRLDVGQTVQPQNNNPLPSRPGSPSRISAAASRNPSGTSSIQSYSSAPLASNSGTAVNAGEPKTTRTLSSSIDAQGRRMVNQYVRLKTIGQGSHGKVWLCTEPRIREESETEYVGKGKSTSWDDAGDGIEGEDEDVGYCAIKSVARELGGKGKSLRHAKGRKEEQLKGIGNDDQVKREVAIMKRLHHRNVVRLKEVIDDVKSKKVFMVLEFMAGGQIVWQDEHDNPTMTVDEARQTFRDVVVGLEYLHYQGIIHRDIKPANLLWTEDHSLVKISDFGVSHVSDALDRASPDDGVGQDDTALRKTAGSPAFFAPELCHAAESTPTPTASFDAESYFGATASSTVSSPAPSVRNRTLTSVTISRPLRSTVTSPLTAKPRPTIGKSIDVWALGITLYCLLFGSTPFVARTEYELYNVIVKEAIEVPERMGAEGLWTGVGKGWPGCGDGVEGREAVDLLSKLLEKDPDRRISLAEVKTHPWVLRNLSSPSTWLLDNNPAQASTVIITEDDVNHATQARGEIQSSPRARTGIRKALNTALQRFPNFSKSKKLVLVPEGTEYHVRSKSASSASRSISASDGGSRSRPPSRQPSDAANSKYPASRIGRDSAGTPNGRAPKGRWSFSRDGDSREDGVPTVSVTRTPSTASHRPPDVASPGSISRLQSPTRPVTRNASPLPSSDVDAQSTTASAGRLSKLLSRLGSRLHFDHSANGSITSSLFPSEDALAAAPTVQPNSRQAFASKRSSLPVVGAQALAAVAHADERRKGGERGSDESDSSVEYSSDDDDFAESPIDRADAQGWHSSLAPHAVSDSQLTVAEVVLAHPVYHQASYPLPDHLAFDAAPIEVVPKRVGAGGTRPRDGSIAMESNAVPRGGQKWSVYGEDDDEDGEDDIFFSTRKKQSVSA